MPGKIRSARSRRHDDKRTELLTLAIPRKEFSQQDFANEMPLADVLWNSTSALRQQVLQTYFIKGLNNGTLDPVKFGQYVVQDAVYCYNSKLHLDMVASRSSDGTLEKFFLEESSEFKSYYESMFKEWSIGKPDGIKLNSACQEYTDFTSKVAAEKDPVYFIVASIPCVRLWPWIGKQFKESQESSGLYQKWVDENFPPDNATYRKWEEYVNTSAGIDVDTAKEIYTECMKGELGFFGSIEE